MLATMKKKTGKPAAKSRGKVFNVRLGDDLEAAVTKYIELQEVQPDKTSVILTALRKFLAEKGLWPPPAESD